MVPHIPVGPDGGTRGADRVDGVGRIAEDIDPGHRVLEIGILEKHVEADVVADEVVVLAEVPASIEVESVPQGGPVAHFNRAHLLGAERGDVEVLHGVQVAERQSVGRGDALPVINEARDGHEAVPPLEVAHEGGRTDIEVEILVGERGVPQGAGETHPEIILLPRLPDKRGRRGENPIEVLVLVGPDGGSGDHLVLRKPLAGTSI